MAPRVGVALSVLVAALGVASAARVHEAQVLASSPRRRGRQLLAAALLLGGPGGLVQGGTDDMVDIQARFENYDSDGSGRLCFKEYEDGMVEATYLTEAPSPDIDLKRIFVKADIDWDEHLNMRELIFAEQLLLHEQGRDVCGPALRVVCHQFDETFRMLGRRGDVTFKRVLQDVSKFYGTDPESLDEDTRSLYVDAFSIADVLRDRVLNTQEVEFMWVVVRGYFIEDQVDKAKDEAAREEKKIKDFVNHFFTEYDNNEDGALQLSEVTETLLRNMGQSIAQKTLLRELMRIAFPRIDADGDGVLDRTEARELYERLWRMHWPIMQQGLDLDVEGA